MTWSRWFDLTPNEVANEVPTTRGVFCVARKRDMVRYVSGETLTVLLGKAPDRQRGLRAVLHELASGTHRGLHAERSEHGGLRFCFQPNLGDSTDTTFAGLVADFESQYGESPRCNPR